MKIPDSQKKKRPLRIAAEILRDLPSILRKHVPISSELMISITDVDVSGDLSFAKIYFSVLGSDDPEMPNKVERILNANKGIVRKELSQLLIMRQHPDLRFYYDETLARAARIEALLSQVRKTSEGENGL